MSLSKATSNKGPIDAQSVQKQSQINRVNKKGTTLGAQHASHGDRHQPATRNKPFEDRQRNK